MLRCFTVLVFALASPVSGQVRITYLANEGVLIAAGDKKVLVDALFRDSLEDYPRHSPTAQEQMETGQPPFDGVQLALATHYHLDHWDAGAISRFLRVNPSAAFAAAPEAVGMMPAGVRQRVHALGFGGSPVSLDVSGIRVVGMPLIHSRTQNLAYRVLLGGRSVVHLGDAEPSTANFERLGATSSPDVLLVPFWWLLDTPSREFLARWNPKNLIAFHLGTADAAKSADDLRKTFPGLWVCTEAGVSRVY